MKVIEQLKPTSTFLAFRPIFDERLDATQTALAVELMRPMDQLPVMNITLRALELVIRNFGRAGANASLIDITLQIASALRAFGDWVKFSVQADKRKGEEFLSGSSSMITATLAAETGMSKYLQDGTITAGDIVALLAFARQGSGPAFSEPDAAKVLRFFAMAKVIEPDHKSLGEEAGRRALYNKLLLIRFTEFARGVLTTKAPVMEILPDNVASTAQVRIEAAYKAAAMLASLAVSSVADLTNHVRSLLLHPWMRQLAKGETSDAVTRWAAELQSRRMVLPAVPQWPELAVQGLYDSSFSGLFAFKVKPALEDINEGTAAWGRPLLNQMTLLSDGIGRTALSTVTGIMWGISEYFESAYASYKAASAGFAMPLRLVPIDGNPLKSDSLVTTIPSVTSQYSFYPKRMSVFRWSPRTDIARTFATPLSPMRLHTLEKFRVAAAGQGEAAKWIPSVVVGPADNSMASFKNALVPFFKPWNEPMSRLPINRDSLLQFIGLTDFDLREMIAGWSGATSLDAMVLAERLRYVGVIVIATDGKGEVIPTLDGSWYHCYDVRPFMEQDSDKHIELGYAPLASVRTHMSLGTQARVSETKPKPPTRPTDLTASVKVSFVPFTAIPCSAVLSSLKNNQREVPQTQLRPHRPVFAWVWAQQEEPQALMEIDAWQVWGDSVRDVVFHESYVDSPQSLVTVTGSDDNEDPFAYFAANAIIGIDGDDSPSAPLASLEVPRKLILPRPDLASDTTPIQAVEPSQK
jgi:hypothetical protein